MRRLSLAGLVLFAFCSPACANMFCVQRGLANLHYQPGPVDGLYGSLTATAAENFAADFGVSLAPLKAANSSDWCAAVSGAMASAEGLERRFDIAATPAGVLSGSQTQALWTAYETAPQCFEHPTYGAGTASSLPLLRPEEMALSTWRAPYTAAIGAPACSVDPVNFARPPAPIPTVALDEAYGERQIAVDAAMDWFMRASTYVRMTGDPVARLALRQAVLEWAEAGSLGSGINVSWGHRPVDYQMMAAIMSVVAATAEILPDLTEADRAVIGPWLNGLVAKVAASRWKDRQDNKAYMTAYIAMIWGIMVGDDTPVQEAIDVYKLAVHDMRPDGSFPIDTQRSGMGLSYNSGSATYLVMIAAALRNVFGLDLFDYTVDGRSGHDAVKFVMRSIQSPSETNGLYAISCPDGGDRWGSVDDPSLHFIDEASYLLVYADMFPDRPLSAQIAAHFTSSSQGSTFNERVGGAPSCQFALPTGRAFEGEPLVIEGVALPLPAPRFNVVAREELAHASGNENRINSLFFAEVSGAEVNRLDFNIRASFTLGTGEVRGLSFTVNPPLGTTVPSGLSECGAGVTRTYDDGQHRLEIRFDQSGTVFSARQAECLIANVPEPSRSMARFLMGNFRDIAIGMVNHGTVDQLAHHGLRAWITAVAEGRVEVQAAP